MSSDGESIDEEEQEEEVKDNFIQGVHVTEVTLDVDEQKINDVITNCRKIVAMVKKSSILTSFIEKKRTKFNIRVKRRADKIKRKLMLDVRTRWNSTFLMLNTLKVYRDILMDMFKSKTTIHLTATQRRKLNDLELTSDMWDIIDDVISLLRPFYSATKVLSTTKYPTMGSTLYIVRALEQYLESHEPNRFLNQLKFKMLKMLREYVHDDFDQWSTLKVMSMDLYFNHL